MPKIIMKQKVYRAIKTNLKGAFLLLAYLSIIFNVYFGYLPKVSLIGLITIVMAVPTFVGAFRDAENIEKLVPYMGLDVIINILTPGLVAVGLFVA